MRQHGHFIGDVQAYRSKAELEQCRAHDPLMLFRQRVAGEGRLAPEVLDATDAQCRQLVTEAVAAAREAPVPAIGELLTDVYVSY
jgi:pyruvate dehydrogenase E1 component alpha subunit